MALCSLLIVAEAEISERQQLILSTRCDRGLSADGLWPAHLLNCRLFGPALGMGTAELCPRGRCPASHKVVPHRLLLIRAVASDIFGADQSMVLELDAQALDWNPGVQWTGVLTRTARQLIGADL